MQIYVNSMNKSSILLMVLDWLTAQCSMEGGDARYIWIFRIFYARRIFNSWDKTWDKICIFWGEVAGGDILRPKFDCRLFWEVDEGARPLGEHLKGFECEQISLILLKTSLILKIKKTPKRMDRSLPQLNLMWPKSQMLSNFFLHNVPFTFGRKS